MELARRAGGLVVAACFLLASPICSTGAGESHRSGPVDGEPGHFCAVRPLPLRACYSRCILVLKRVWGALMAKILPTDVNLPAIDLKHFHSRDILYLDDEIDATVTGTRSNGGFAEIFLEVKHGLIGIIKFLKTSRPENRQPTDIEPR